MNDIDTYFYCYLQKDHPRNPSLSVHLAAFTIATEGEDMCLKGFKVSGSLRTGVVINRCKARTRVVPSEFFTNQNNAHEKYTTLW